MGYLVMLWGISHTWVYAISKIVEVRFATLKRFFRRLRCKWLEDTFCDA